MVGLVFGGQVKNIKIEIALGVCEHSSQMACCDPL